MVTKSGREMMKYKGKKELMEIIPR